MDQKIYNLGMDQSSLRSADHPKVVLPFWKSNPEIMDTGKIIGHDRIIYLLGKDGIGERNLV